MYMSVTLAQDQGSANLKDVGLLVLEPFTVTCKDHDSMFYGKSNCVDYKSLAIVLGLS